MPASKDFSGQKSSDSGFMHITKSMKTSLTGFQHRCTGDLLLENHDLELRNHICFVGYKKNLRDLRKPAGSKRPASGFIGLAE